MEPQHIQIVMRQIHTFKDKSEGLITSQISKQLFNILSF